MNRYRDGSAMLNRILPPLRWALVLLGPLGLIGAAPMLAVAQPPNLVHFALDPETLLEFSVQNTVADSKTSIEGSETESHREGLNGLAGWAPLPVTVAVAAQRESIEQTTDASKVFQGSATRAALAGLRFGYFAVVAQTLRTEFRSEARDLVHDQYLKLLLDAVTDAQYGVVMNLGVLRAAYLVGHGHLALDFSASAYKPFDETYDLATASYLLGLALGGEKGPFLTAEASRETSKSDSGTDVDFEGAHRDGKAASIGWKFGKGAGMSLGYTENHTETEFQDFVTLTVEDRGYRLGAGQESGLSLFLGLQTQEAEQKFVPAGVFGTIRTESRALELGFGWRF
jgi:hypothetical protein